MSELLVRQAAVLGSPISHSLSPVIHRHAYQLLGLPHRYYAYEVTEAELPEFLAQRLRAHSAKWLGLSLTMPLKQTVIPLLDKISPLVQVVGAANTVVLEEHEGSSVRLRGENTDVPGMVAALAERGGMTCQNPLVLGAGATARSALAALAHLGVTHVQVAARNLDRARGLDDLARRLGVKLRLFPWRLCPADLVIATTPGGSTDSLLPQVAAVAGAHCPLFDVAYDPWPSPLAAEWQSCGGGVISGLDLLVHQAVVQVEMMTGTSPPVEPLRIAAEQALSQRHAADGQGK